MINPLIGGMCVMLANGQPCDGPWPLPMRLKDTSGECCWRDESGIIWAIEVHEGVAYTYALDANGRRY